MRSAQGFTLVELLVVVVIMVILTSATIPSFIDYIENQGLIQASEQYKNDFRFIQNKAMTGVEAGSTINSLPVKYWGLRINKATGDYNAIVLNDVAPADLVDVCVGNSEQSANWANRSNYKLRQSAWFKASSFAVGADKACVFFRMNSGDSTFVSYQMISGIYPIVMIGYQNEGDCKNSFIYPNGVISSVDPIGDVTRLCTD